jgi:GAF domain-containing protein
MATDRAVPARGPPRIETFYESDRTRVSRVCLPERTVIRKERLGPSWQTRLRHELGVLERLQGVPGVGQLAAVAPYPGAIMLDDLDGPTLAGVGMPYPSDRLCDLAIALGGRREPLVVSDAVRDDRFARDPFFAGAKCCSLLAVPILNRGAMQGLLLLENRLIRSAFSVERLDGLMRIASQLPVSLDNAMVYASLERKVAARTDELAVANAQLEKLSITDPLTGLANRRRLEEALT